MLIMVAIFVVGLLVRLFVNTLPEPDVNCVPVGQTAPPGVTLLPCNDTFVTSTQSGILELTTF